MKMQAKVKKHSLKVLSVFLAIFLWVYVLNSEKVKFEKTVALEYVLPSDLLFAERPLQEVVFLIEGPRAFVRSVAEREDKLVIDLNRVNKRRLMNFSVDIVPTQLNLPFGMVVERVLPRKIQIKLEKKASKIVPVKAQFTGSLPSQMTLARAQVEPAEVEVMGPRSLIVKLKEVQTRPIELETLLGQSEIPVEIQFPDERFSLESGRNAKLLYQLKAAGANMVLKDIPVRFLTQSKVASSSTKTVTLKLLVPPTLKDRSNISSSLQVWADIPDGKRGKLEVPLKAIVPPGIHLIEISPKSIIVNVE